MAKWVMSVMSSTGYVGIALLMFIENVFPPIPSELIMPLAGYMATRTQLSFAGIVIAGTLGSMLGALPLYYLGSKIGEERLKDLADAHGRWLTISGDDIETAKNWFDRHGAVAVLLGRIVPGVRSLVSIPAGIAGLHLAPFLLYTAVGSAIWTALLAYLGHVLGSNFQQVGEYIDPISWVVLGVVLAIYFVRVARHKGSNRRFPG